VEWGRAENTKRGAKAAEDQHEWLKKIERKVSEAGPAVAG
jgi:hypothetical protein